MFKKYCLGISLLFTATLSLSQVPTWDNERLQLLPDNRQLKQQIIKQLKQYRNSLRNIEASPSPDSLALGEQARIQQLMRSQGFYNAVTSYNIVEESDGLLLPEYRVSTGEQFVVSAMNTEGYLPESYREIEVGDALTTDAVLAQQAAIESEIRDSACYFRLSVAHEVRLNDNQSSASLTFVVDKAQPSRFASVRFSGDIDVDERYLQRQTGIRQRDCFQRQMIDQAVLNLYQTQLFSSVQRRVSRNEDGLVDVEFILTRRPARTISASVGWDTTESFNLDLGWQNRNLFGYAQWLTVDGEFQRERQAGITSLTLPGFRSAGNTLRFENSLERETPNESIFYVVQSSVGLARIASRNETYNYRISLRHVRENTPDDSAELTPDEWEIYTLAGFSASYSFDDNPGNFNPRRGQKYRIAIEPVISVREDGYSFVQTQLNWASFRPFVDQLVLANDLQWKSVWSETNDQSKLPESDRFLIGGSGSLRGYPFKSIGVANSALNDIIEPGTQQINGSLELRAQLTDVWGATLFTDAAQVTNSLADFSQDDWRFGAGVGIRYFTPFAPIRFDLAVPLNSSPDDRGWQIYISLGQAF